MLPKAGAIAMVLLAGAQVCRPVFGQAPPTILTVDLENQTRYVYDVADPQKFAIDPGVTTSNTPTNFYSQVLISDIVAVNGQPVKGVQILRETILRLNPSGLPGQAISDFGVGARRRATSSATAAVKESVDSVPPRSLVRTPPRRRSRVAVFTAWPRAISPIW